MAWLQSAYLQDILTILYKTPREQFLRFIVETMCIEMNKSDIWALNWKLREAEVVPSLAFLKSHQQSVVFRNKAPAVKVTV